MIPNSVRKFKLLARTILVFLGASPAHADDLYFRIVNSTPEVITEVHVRASDSREGWRPNSLDLNGLFPGARYELRDFAAAPPCVYDVGLTVQVGNGRNDREFPRWDHIDLCALNTLFVYRIGPNTYHVNWQND